LYGPGSRSESRIGTRRTDSGSSAELDEVVSLVQSPKVLGQLFRRDVAARAHNLCCRFLAQGSSKGKKAEEIYSSYTDVVL
jgi:hypothetical protein